MALKNFTSHLARISCQNVQFTGIRMYARWAHREPARVLLQMKPDTENPLKQEKIIDLNSEALRTSREKHGEKLKLAQSKKKSLLIPELNSSKVPTDDLDEVKTATHEKTVYNIDKEKIKMRREEAKKALQKMLSNKIVFDENGELVYEKLKENDGRVSALLTNLKSKKGRIRTNQVLVEGWRLIVDGIQAKCPIRYIIFSRITDLDNIKTYLPKKGVKIYKIPYKEIELWSSVDTSSGLIGIFEKPTPDRITLSEKPLPLHIICDNVRDPGNLGAILRACVGVGCDKVLLTKGCVDLWEPKVVRSAAGAHFRMPIHSSVEWQQIEELIQKNSSILIADNNFKVKQSKESVECYEDGDDLENVQMIEDLNMPVIPYYSMDYSTLSSITLIIGGETEGISEESYRFAASRSGVRVNIPLQKGVDSLNTGMAAAVIAFEIKKQILEAKAEAKKIKQQI